MDDVMINKFFEDLPMMMFETYIEDLTGGKKPDLVKNDLKAREQAMERFGAKNDTAPIVLMFAAFAAGVDSALRFCERLEDIQTENKSAGVQLS